MKISTKCLHCNASFSVEESVIGKEPFHHSGSGSAGTAGGGGKYGWRLTNYGK